MERKKEAPTPATTMFLNIMISSLNSKNRTSGKNSARDAHAGPVDASCSTFVTPQGAASIRVNHVNLSFAARG
jgi:hypothetical protein